MPPSLPPVPSILPLIDHTLLRPEARPSDVERLVAEALEQRFHAVCVNGVYVARCAELAAGTALVTCAVVGFPLGAATPAAKRAEAERALADGARELDMVLWIGGLVAGLDARVAADIAGVAELARQGGALLKVILETALLDDETKRRACRLARASGAHFVKTSTGFAQSGASVHDVALLCAAVGDALGVKAAGGIGTLALARALVAAGATRLGTSRSLALAAEERAESAGGG